MDSINVDGTQRNRNIDTKNTRKSPFRGGATGQIWQHISNTQKKSEL